MRVLTEPSNSLVRQYQHLFELDGIDLEFTHEALLAIAARANERKTGARGLSSIMEQTLSDLMFDLPSRDDVARVVITRDLVEGVGPRRALPGTLLGRQAQRLSPPATLRSVETLGGNNGTS